MSMLLEPWNVKFIVAPSEIASTKSPFWKNWNFSGYYSAAELVKKCQRRSDQVQKCSYVGFLILVKCPDLTTFRLFFSPPWGPCLSILQRVLNSCNMWFKTWLTGISASSALLVLVLQKRTSFLVKTDFPYNAHDHNSLCRCQTNLLMNELNGLQLNK